MIHEVWGTSGTAGDYGWEYGTATPSITTRDGTQVLSGLNDYEAGTIGTGYTYNGGTWYNRIWLNDTTSAIYRQVIADAGNGTALWLEITQTNISPWRNTIRWQTLAGGSYTDIGSAVENRSGAYNDFIANTVEWDGTNYVGSMELQAVAGLVGTTAVLSTDGNFTTAPTGSAIIPRFEMDDGGISEIIFPYYIPPDRSILDFVGTYNNGTNIGTLALGTYAIDIGQVREQLYTPRNSRGWSSKSTVELDNISDWWQGTLAKDMTTPSFLDGTWIISQQWNDTWATLLTGYVQPADITIDYGLKKIKLSVSSNLEKLAKTTLIPYDPQPLGTIAAIDYDGTKGRTRIAGMDSGGGTLYVNELLWSGTGTTGESVAIQHFYNNHDEEWSGTWIADGIKSVYFRKDPDWLEVGGSVYRSESTRGWATQDYIYELMNLSVSRSRTEAEWQRMISLGTDAVRYYGGEPAIDALNDFMRARGISYSINGEGTVVEYVQKPELPAPAGTLNFNGVYGAKWSFDYTNPVNSVTVKYNYDNPQKKNLSEVTHEAGTFYGGDNTDIDGAWIEPTGFYPRARAQREYLTEGIPRMKLGIQLKGTAWLKYNPGDAVVIENTPSIISDQETNESYPLVPFSKWLITGRTYDYKTDLINYDLIHHKIRGIFRLDLSQADGSDVVW